MKEKIPYKIYLDENEMPKKWYNVRADMKNKPAPLLNPATLKPITLDELSQVFCRELALQELDDETAYIDIPDEILDYYKTFRPSPLVRAYNLEKHLNTPAKIYYKFEILLISAKINTITYTYFINTNSSNSNRQRPAKYSPVQPPYSVVTVKYSACLPVTASAMQWITPLSDPIFTLPIS